MTEITHYANIEQFYEIRGGADSGERNYGVWHEDDIGLFSPRTDWPIEAETQQMGDETLTMYSAERNSSIRVSVVNETGDVYAVQDGLGEGRVVLIGNVGVTNPHHQAPRTHRRGIGPVYRRANDIFEGWASRPADYPELTPFGRGVSWFVNRLREAERNPRTLEDELSDLATKLPTIPHSGIGMVDGILSESHEETFAKFTTLDAIIFQAYSIYSRETLQSQDPGQRRYAQPDEWYKTSPPKRNFRDWLMNEFKYQLLFVKDLNTDELTEVRRQWIEAMAIISEEAEAD